MPYVIKVNLKKDDGTTVTSYYKGKNKQTEELLFTENIHEALMYVDSRHAIAHLKIVPKGSVSRYKPSIQIPVVKQSPAPIPVEKPVVTAEVKDTTQDKAEVLESIKENELDYESFESYGQEQFQKYLKYLHDNKKNFILKKDERGRVLVYKGREIVDPIVLPKVEPAKPTLTINKEKLLKAAKEEKKDTEKVAAPVENEVKDIVKQPKPVKKEKSAEKKKETAKTESKKEDTKKVEPRPAKTKEAKEKKTATPKSEKKKDEKVVK